MDLLIEQEVLKLLLVQLQLQLQLLFLMMNRLFTCKIKEHNEIIVQLAPLAPLQPPTTNKFGFKYILVGARVTSIAAVRIG